MEMPPLKEKYDHEDTSLMMIDFALSCVGLEIDWDNLDKPLKQIGDGTDAERFGAVLGGDKYDQLTSRDWIFIKEVRVGVYSLLVDVQLPRLTMFCEFVYLQLNCKVCDS